jgi:hypothetical protein
MLAGNSTLTQMGFAIDFGIAIAAFVMALFFTRPSPPSSATPPGGPSAGHRLAPGSARRR